MAQVSAHWGALPRSAFRYGYSAEAAMAAYPTETASGVVGLGGRSNRFGFGWRDAEPYPGGSYVLEDSVREALEACEAASLRAYPIISYEPDYKTLEHPELTAVAKGGDTVLHVTSVSAFAPFKLYVDGEGGADLTINSMTNAAGMLVAATDPVAKTITLATPISSTSGATRLKELKGEVALRELPIGYRLQLNRCLYDPMRGLDPSQEGVVAHTNYLWWAAAQAHAHCSDVRLCLGNEGFTFYPWANGATLWMAPSWDPANDWQIADFCSWNGVVYTAAQHMTKEGSKPGPHEPGAVGSGSWWTAYAQPSRAEAHIPACPNDWRTHVYCRASFDSITTRLVGEPLPSGVKLLPGMTCDIGGMGIHRIYDPTASPSAAKLSKAVAAFFVDPAHIYGENPDKGTCVAVAKGASLMSPDYEGGSSAFRALLMKNLERRAEGYAAPICSSECGNVDPMTELKAEAGDAAVSHARARYDVRRVLGAIFNSYDDVLLYPTQQAGGVEDSIRKGELTKWQEMVAMARVARMIEELGEDNADPSVAPVLAPSGGAWGWAWGAFVGQLRAVAFCFADTAMLVPGSKGWEKIASPAPIAVPYTLDPRTRVLEALNVVTGAAVSYAGGQIPVADDPIALVVAIGEPSSDFAVFTNGANYLIDNGLEGRAGKLALSRLSADELPASAVLDGLGKVPSEATGTGYAQKPTTVGSAVTRRLPLTPVTWATGSSTDWPSDVRTAVLIVAGHMVCAWNLKPGGAALDLSSAASSETFSGVIAL